MNKKSVIFDSIVIGLATIAAVLLFIPFDIVGTLLSMFNFGIFAFQMGAEGLIFGIAIFLALASLVIVLAFSVVSLLVACGTIKNHKLGKAFRITSIVFSSIATLVSALLVMAFSQMSTVALLMALVMALANIANIVLLSLSLAASKLKAVEAPAAEPVAETASKEVVEETKTEE